MRPPQTVELVEQIERQRGSGEIDAELVLQTQRALHARQRKAREPPLRAIASRGLDDALRDDLDDDLLGDAARRAQLPETELDGVVERHGADRVGHHELSIACLKFVRSVSAICL